jgi:hypothetical protein
MSATPARRIAAATRRPATRAARGRDSFRILTLALAARGANASTGAARRPTLQPTVFVPSPVGTYRLYDLDAGTLPGILVDERAYTLGIVSGLLFVRPDFRYTLRVTLVEIVDFRVRVLVRQISGWWHSVEPASVRFRSEDDPAFDAAGMGRVDGDGRTLELDVALSSPRVGAAAPRRCGFRRP